MKKLLILLSFLSYACAEKKSVEGSCGLNYFYDEVNNECLEFCKSEDDDIDLAYVFNPNTKQYVCSTCIGDNQYVTNGLCITCSASQIKVNNGNDIFSCRNITACYNDMGCNSSNNLVCNQNLGYCVNCTKDSDCGVGRYCNNTQYDGTCILKKSVGKTCEYDNECNSGACTIEKTCACQTNNECVLFGISIGEDYTTCNAGTGLCY